MNRIGFNRVILPILWLAFASVPSIAGEQQTQRIQVRSEYRTSHSSPWGGEIRWRFERTASDERSVRVNDNSDHSYVLAYSNDDRLKEVVRIRSEKDGRKTTEPVDISKAGPYRLSDGYPLPFDDLDADNENDDAVTMKKSAGGVSFAFPLTRKVEALSMDKAISEAMIPPSFKERHPEKRLLMISMLKKGSLMVRQLWVVGEDWWRYEETPFRRSWRVVE